MKTLIYTLLTLLISSSSFANLEITENEQPTLVCGSSRIQIPESSVSAQLFLPTMESQTTRLLVIQNSLAGQNRTVVEANLVPVTESEKIYQSEFAALHINSDKKGRILGQLILKTLNGDRVIPMNCLKYYQIQPAVALEKPLQSQLQIPLPFLGLARIDLETTKPSSPMALFFLN